MAGIYQFDTIASYNDFNNHETLHPLVSVIDFGNAKPRSWDGNTSVKINYGFYTIFLKDVKCGDLKYGCNIMTTKKAPWFLWHQGKSWT